MCSTAPLQDSSGRYSQSASMSLQFSRARQDLTTRYLRYLVVATNLPPDLTSGCDTPICCILGELKLCSHFSVLFSFKIPLDTKTNEIEQRVEPHNDYFSTQFLLNFSILGTHTVTVEASVVDESGTEWKTGPKTTVSVKSLEDPYSQQLRHQLQQGGAQPAPQRGAYTRF